MRRNVLRRAASLARMARASLPSPWPRSGKDEMTAASAVVNAVAAASAITAQCLTCSNCSLVRSSTATALPSRCDPEHRVHRPGVGDLLLGLLHRLVRRMHVRRIGVGGSPAWLEPQ